jgi:beta-phosphoglucomutase-like phosphatase (HAD superfamily)
MIAPFAFRTILCDVDGTLIDSNGAHAESWATAFREHGVRVAACRLRPLIGMGGDKRLLAVAQMSEESPEGKVVAKRKKTIFAKRPDSVR